MSSYYFKNTKYNTIGYSHLRDIQSKRDKFTVLPEFGITVFDADNPPFERDNNYRVHDVYAHIPSRESQIQKRGAYQANQNLTTMYKRKAPSSAYNNARFDAEFGPSAPVALKVPRTSLQMRAASQKAEWQKKSSLATQVRRLIQGKKKDAADQIGRRSGANANTATFIYCPHSSDASATATSGNGLVVTDADRATINYVHVKGNLCLGPIPCTRAQAELVFGNARVRHLMVWYYKPSTAAVAAGTLPPITDVLVSDSVDSYPLSDAANSGRFTILSDRVYDLGRNLKITDECLGQDGDGGVQYTFNQIIKVGKEQHYAAACTNSLPGGHYDSDQAPGRVTRGLMVGYFLYTKGGGVAATDAGENNITLHTRINYTA